jgi:hypothetical protein
MLSLHLLQNCMVFVNTLMLQQGHRQLSGTGRAEPAPVGAWHELASRQAALCRHRFPAEVISQAIWLYFRFPLGMRMVEEVLAARGVIVSHETVRGCPPGWCAAPLSKPRSPRPRTTPASCRVAAGRRRTPTSWSSCAAASECGAGGPDSL